MNVGGPQVDRFTQHLIDELDDRCILRRIGQVQVLIVARVDHLHIALGIRDERLERISPDAQEPLHAAVNLIGRGQDRAHIAAAGEPQFVERS